MTYWLNQVLNRFSMYRLLSITLTTMWGFSIILSLFGLLPHSPTALIASGVVLIIAAYLFNVLFGRLFGVRPHDESSYISALILFFIFSPTAVITELSTLALAAMMAMASKYVLAIRGRHIFNPAAIAAVIISLTGITYTSWWIATPILLPITLLFAFLILYKTRRLTVGYIFLAIAIPLIILTYILNGQTTIEALLALPSWPLLFFVGFMLSEPLTLPPRRWQQYLTAAIVAILFAIPLHIGSISGSPALALVIGNAFAFYFTQRQHIRLTFKGRKQLTPTIDEYTFKASKPIRFAAGQYMEITVPHPGKDGRGIRRIFSIVAAPNDRTVRFGVKMYDRPSSFKRTLRSLEKGTIVDATGINGDFILPKDTNIPLLFIAGGVGITPFISHILTSSQHDQNRDIIVIYAVTDINDMAYVDVLKKSNVKVIVVTKTSQSMPVASWLHLNNSRFTSPEIETYIPDAGMRHAYVSGPPAMVDATKSVLKKSGVTHIKSDYFTGY